MVMHTFGPSTPEEDLCESEAILVYTASFRTARLYRAPVTNKTNKTKQTNKVNRQTVSEPSLPSTLPCDLSSHPILP